MKTKSIAFGVCLVVSFSAHVMAADYRCPESANKFWTSFRQDVLVGDKRKVAGYVQYPFEIRGTLDSSPVRKVNREGFMTSFQRLLNSDPGMSLTPTTMISLVKSTQKLAAASCSQAGNEFSVGDWDFVLTKGGWRFVRAYLED